MDDRDPRVWAGTGISPAATKGSEDAIEQMNAPTVGRRGPSAASSTFVEATISLVAGRGVAGYLGDGGPATAASLQHPTGVALDHDGNADAANHRIRRVDPAGRSLPSRAPAPPGSQATVGRPPRRGCTSRRAWP
jgi:hypothetical protein